MVKFSVETRRLLEVTATDVNLGAFCSRGSRKYDVVLVSGKSGPKEQVALHYYYTSPSHRCTSHGSLLPLLLVLLIDTRSRAKIL